MVQSKSNKKIIDITNINEKVYNLLKQRIIHLEYPPGYKISIRKLQDELGVSNSPIKDALFRLAGEELVEISSRKGTYVNEITEQDISEIEQVRTILEIGAAEIAIKNITDEQIEKLEALYIEAHFPKEEIEYSRFMEIDSKFHMELINITQNRRLIKVYKRLNAHMQIVRFQFVRNRKGPLPWTQEDHLKILEALKQRDLEKLKTAIRNHINRARDAFLKK
jgi:DNA-binding GntR family transcriptional regulator